MKFRIHPLYLALGAVYVFFGQGWLFLAYLVAVVMHECCHMLVARRHGVACDNITLYPYGGEIKLNYVNIPTLDEIKIALAGPLSNLLMATVLLALWWLVPASYPVTEPFYWANVSTGIGNLIPVYPLDGGRVLVSLLKLKCTKYKAIVTAKVLGFVACAALFAFGVYALAAAGNFSYLSMSVFLFLGQLHIKTDAYTNSYLSSRKKDLLRKRGLKECVTLVPESALLYELVSQSNRDYYYIFDVVNENYERVGRIEESQLYALAQHYDIYSPIGGLVAGQSAKKMV